MRTISPQNAQKLSVWLAIHDPDVLRVLAHKGRGVSLRGLSSFPRFAGRGVGRLGATGATLDFSLTPSSGSTFTSSFSTAPSFGTTLPANDTFGTTLPSFSTGPVAGTTAGFGTGSLSSPIVTGNTAPAGNTSPGFWSSLASSVASGAASVGSSVLSDLGSAASFLTSPQGISTVAQLAAVGATTYAAVNASNNATQVQLARVAAGQSPAPVSYDAQGNPVYYGSAGAQRLTGAQLGSLAPTNLFPYLLIGGAVLLLLMLS